MFVVHIYTASKIFTKMDAHINWTEPYNVGQIKDMLKSRNNTSGTVCDLAFDGTKSGQVSLIVETPSDVWAAWRLNGQKGARVALALDTDNKNDASNLISQQVSRIQKIFNSEPSSIECVRVPGVTNITCESAPAAVFNIEWLVSGKKRTHPGPSAYLEVRTEAYKNYMKTDT